MEESLNFVEKLEEIVVKEEIANGKLPENVSYPYCCHFSKQS